MAENVENHTMEVDAEGEWQQVMVYRLAVQ